jgi:hypothetical protein
MKLKSLTAPLVAAGAISAGLLTMAPTQAATITAVPAPSSTPTSHYVDPGPAPTHKVCNSVNSQTTKKPSEIRVNDVVDSRYLLSGTCTNRNNMASVRINTLGESFKVASGQGYNGACKAATKSYNPPNDREKVTIKTFKFAGCKN